MTDEIFEKESETADPIDVPAVEDAPAEVFTAADLAARLSEARLSWEAERERETAAAAVEMTAEIESLREALARADERAARRETEIRCEKMLRAHSLGEEMVSLLLTPYDTDLTDEILSARVEMLAGAIDAAAARAIREKTEGIRPGMGEASALTGKIIRETPIAKLAEMM